MIERGRNCFLGLGVNFSLENRRKYCLKLIMRTREGCHLPPTAETEANGDLGSTNERGSSQVSSGSSCLYQRFLSCVGCSSKPCTKSIFPPRTLFHFMCPHRPASWAGSRAGSPVSEFMKTFSCCSICFFNYFLAVNAHTRVSP